MTWDIGRVPPDKPLADLTVEEACTILDDKLGSGSDPIRFRGTDMDISDLQYSEYARSPQKLIRISYWGKNGFVKGGTLAGMIKDRKRCLTY